MFTAGLEDRSVGSEDREAGQQTFHHQQSFILLTFINKIIIN